MKADEMELSLELSIGGCYKNIEKARIHENENEKMHHEVDVSNNNTSSKSDASESYVVGCVQDEIFSSDSADPLKKREIQALRRREAIKKREEKQKRWASSRSKGGVHERIHLEMQRNQARAMDRERRENESSEEFFMKRDKMNNSAKLNMNNNGGGKDICLGNLVQPMRYNNKCLKVFQNGNNCGDSDLEHGDKRVVSNGLIERSSSAFLDYHSTSQKAGSSSTDTGNHSNYSQEGQQQLTATATTDNPEISDFNGSSSRVQSDQANGKTPTILLTMSSSNIPSPEKCERTNKLNATPQAQPSSTSRQCNKPVIMPPAPQGNKQSPTPLPRMPLVSTTGNSPNGKTVNGFLYSYSKLEVSIVCVCHGRSFSPAEFVEHAGGVNISHPLKHITIVPTSFS
ncbi:hypothetical protein Leryth_003314 [Lithospermum erythrorhizon]|nr:hypothetical protein Leryth_003314 [Lithospermum erythrorhizon]